MKTYFFKYIFYTILIVLIAFALYYLYKDENNKSLAIKEDSTILDIQEEINIGIENFDTVNPILSNNIEVQYITKLVFNPLVDLTKDLRIECNLAKEVSKINTEEYIIKLEENIYWHDGSQFTSDDVIFTINNLKNLDSNSIYKENVKDINRVEKIDEYTLKIYLKKEIPFFEYNLCFPILNANLYEEGTLKSKTNLPIGTGKYIIEQIDENKIILSLANKDSKAYIKKINVILEETTSTLYHDFSKGKLDYIITKNLNYESTLGTMGYNELKISNREFDYLVFNCKNKFLKNKEIRKAICYAIDKNSINYNVFNNKYNVCNFPIYNNYYLDQEKQNDFDTFDINKAKNILIENGFNNNKKLKLNLVVNKENENRCKVANQIKECLNKIGIEINILKVNKYSYKNYLKNKNYDIILTGNITSSSPNLETYFGEVNLSNYKNEFLEQILKDINNMGETEEIRKKYKEIYDVYTEEMPFVCLYRDSLFILTSKNLKGDFSCNWYNLFYNIDKWYKVN